MNTQIREYQDLMKLLNLLLMNILNNDGNFRKDKAEQR